MTQEITVRRAKPSDAGRIAAFIKHAYRGRTAFDETSVIERFGGAGFFLAEKGGELIGMLGWRAENLVVHVMDFLVWPAVERAAAAQVLFAEMEVAAAGLQCEVAMLFPPRPIPSGLIGFCKTLGYEPQNVSELAKAWREAAIEAGMGEDGVVLMKRLRTDRVVRPM